MSTHANKRTLKLRELGKSLYRAMKSDWAWADITSEAPLAEDFTPILEWWRDTEESSDRGADLAEAAGHAGLSDGDARELLDYIAHGPLFGGAGTPMLDSRHLWELVRESVDDDGDDAPMPDDWKVNA